MFKNRLAFGMFSVGLLITGIGIGALIVKGGNQ